MTVQSRHTSNLHVEFSTSTAISADLSFAKNAVIDPCRLVYMPSQRSVSWVPPPPDVTSALGISESHSRVSQNASPGAHSQSVRCGTAALSLGPHRGGCHGSSYKTYVGSPLVARGAASSISAYRPIGRIAKVSPLVLFRIFVILFCRCEQLSNYRAFRENL